MRIRAIAQIDEHMVFVRGKVLTDPGNALTAHLAGHVRVSIRHEVRHIVAANPGQGARALPAQPWMYCAGSLNNNAGSERLAWHWSAPLRQPVRRGRNRRPLCCVSQPFGRHAEQGFCDFRHGNRAGLRQQRLAVHCPFCLPASGAFSLAGDTMRGAQLIFDQRAFMLDHQNAFQSGTEGANAFIAPTATALRL